MEREHQPIMPNEYFAQASSECQLCFTEELYFACITLCQSVAEATARFMCDKSGWKPYEYFRQNIRILKREKIEPDVTEYLLNVYGNDRNDFHHLNKEVPKDFEELKRRAKTKLDALNQAEKLLFACAFSDKGGLIPKYPKYWNVQDGKYGVYLRFEH